MEGSKFCTSIIGRVNKGKQDNDLCGNLYRSEVLCLPLHRWIPLAISYGAALRPQQTVSNHLAFHSCRVYPLGRIVSNWNRVPYRYDCKCLCGWQPVCIFSWLLLLGRCSRHVSTDSVKLWKRSNKYPKYPRGEFQFGAVRFTEFALSCWMNISW